MSGPPKENESMDTVPSEPTTEAGRRLTRGYPEDITAPDPASILAIEAEARADALDALRRLVKAWDDGTTQDASLWRTADKEIDAALTQARAILAERQP
jgi:hypothetical protein